MKNNNEFWTQEIHCFLRTRNHHEEQKGGLTVKIQRAGGVLNIKPKKRTFFCVSVQRSKKKTEISWFPKYCFLHGGSVLIWKKKNIVFPGSSGLAIWNYLSISLDLSQTLSQASCSVFFLKPKLMLQKLRPRALRTKSIFSWPFRAPRKENWKLLFFGPPNKFLPMAVQGFRTRVPQNRENWKVHFCINKF